MIDTYSKPECKEAEMSVLGAMMRGGDPGPLTEDSFYRPEHRILFRALREVVPYDGVVFMDKLRRGGEWLEDIGGARYVAEVGQTVVGAGAIDYHIKIVQDYADLRSLGDVAERLKVEGDPHKMAGEAMEVCRDILSKGDTDQPTHHEACALALEEFEQPVTALSTGFTELDNRIVGLEPGLIVIGGATSMGKTTLALSITANLCVAGKRVLFVSREMTRTQLLHRLFAMFGEIPLMAIRERTANVVELSKAASEVMEWDLFIDVKAGTYQEVGAAMDKMGGVDLVVVDYLGLMEGAKADNDHLQLFGIVKGLKRLGTDRLVPVILLSQLSQKINASPKFRPRVGHLKGSGSIGDSANVVLLVYRKDYYIERGIFEGEVDGKVEVTIAKQQQGAPGFALLDFNKQYVRFDNLKGE